MGTVIDRIHVIRGGWRDRHSALHLAVMAARACLQRAGREPEEVYLLVNAGIYRDRNLGEPALAALIQEDIGANPEDPHTDAHGTFSFDIANGTCGVLTALQIVDGFMRSGAIQRALVVASDADPGHGMSAHFPFSPAGAALLCSWAGDDSGLGTVYWVNDPRNRDDTFRATVGFHDARNVLRFSQSASMDEEFAAAAARAAHQCLRKNSLQLSEVEAIIAAPAQKKYLAALSNELAVPVERIIVADDHRMHTVSLAAAIQRAPKQPAVGAPVLLVSAGAGVTAAAAIYRQAANLPQ